MEEYLNVYRCFYRVVGQLVARREFLTYQRQTSNSKAYEIAPARSVKELLEEQPLEQAQNMLGRCGPGRSGAGNRREYDGAGPHSKSDSLPARSGFPCQRFYLLK